ncbi:hypothetical protein [Prosthecobacter vanneervenii]|uniref:Uncharacterized protein n=1 Tax=Prosthecobacter vanneervenii TaxID=48466 RepID=A0A7W7Y7I0_9BACT|nr:hypothetical protein [Prosthecobacter vanneervenii]MBB5031031.1 hypothetical protein [Prosthecobacter vanneervenii]
MPTATHIEAGIEILQEIASNAGTLAGTLAETTSQAAPAVISIGVGGLLDGVEMVSAGKDAVMGGVEIAKKARDELKYKAAKKDPEIQGLLGLRNYANGMLKLQQAAMSEAQQKVAHLDDIAALGAKLAADPNTPLPEGLTPDDAQLLSMTPEERTQAIDTRKQELGLHMEKMQQAANQLDNIVNAVNSHPRISSEAFRKLEAKHNLDNNLGKTGVRTVRDMMNATRAGLGVAGNALGATSTILTAAGVSSAIASTALGAASAGTAIVGGAIMVAGGTAGMAAAAYKHHELSKRQDLASVAAKETMQAAPDAEDPDQAVEMAFALNCVEETARQGKNIEKLKFARNAGIAVAGVGVATMGTGALLSVAGAAGYGAGAAPGLILSGVGGGVAAAGGCVAMGAQAGIHVYKAYQGHLQKQDVNQAKLALEAQDIMMQMVASNTPAQAMELQKKLTPEHLAALNGMKQGLKTTLKGLGVDDAVIAAQLNDGRQVGKFAACVMIQRDPKLASETIAKAALNECQGAFVKRAQGAAAYRGAGMFAEKRAVNIVEADLPKNSPGINALRKLGMDDRKITQTVNALASKSTESIAQKSLIKHTGLK